MAENFIELIAHLDQEQEEAVDWFRGSTWNDGHLQRFMELLVMSPADFCLEAEYTEIDCIQRLARLALIQTFKSACDKFGPDEIIAHVKGK